VNALPQISEAEFEVMKIIWKYAPINTNEITEKLTKTTAWSPKTIHTLIKRLVNKGAISHEKDGRVFVYTPRIKENEYVGSESRHFLKRFYNGDISRMLSSFIEDNKLSKAEIENLRSILSTSRKDRGNTHD
jgi:BlaI family penicillinase repressor